MLGRTPANLPALVTGQAIASPLSAQSNKRLCEAWPSSARNDLLFEPTSVLDINSPSPSSTLSSSIAGSSESGPGPIESKAVAVSGLLSEGTSEVQFLDCTSFLDANDGQAWEIAEDNGAACDDDFEMGAEVVPGWQRSGDIWGDCGRPWDKINHWQDASALGTLDSVEGQFSRMNGGSIDDAMEEGTAEIAGERCSKRTSVAQLRENSSNEEVGDRFTLAPSLASGAKQEDLFITGFMNEVVAEGKLEGCMIPCYQSEALRKRKGGSMFGEVVQRGCGGGNADLKVEEEWLPDWIKAAVLVPEEKAAAPLGSMQCLEEMLLGSPAKPVQEWWLAEIENPTSLAQSQHSANEQFQQKVLAGGRPHLRGGCLDSPEVMNAGLIRGGAAVSTPHRSTPSGSSGLLASAGSSCSFPHRSSTCSFSAPLPVQSAFLSPSFPQPRQFPLQHFPQIPLQFSDKCHSHHFQQLPSDSASGRAPLVPLQSSFQPPFPGSLQHQPPRGDVFPLLNNYANHQQSVLLHERRRRPLETDVGQKQIECHLNAERRLQRLGGELPPPVLHRPVPPPENRQLPIPKLDFSPSQCVGKNVSLNELLLTGKQLSMAAKAAENGDIGMTQAILARLNQQNSPNGQPSQRAAFHFNQALAGRLAGSGSPSLPNQSSSSPQEIISKIGAYKSFCEVSPLPQFAHFTVNQAILEAVEGEDRVHLIDFSLGLGGQWASFMQEISQRSSGPPQLRITTLGGSADSLEMQLARETLLQFARELKLSLDFHALPVARLERFTASMLQSHEKEAVTVNLGFSLDPFLADFSCANSHFLNTFLHLVRSLAPKVVTVIDNKVECEVSDSFFESLQFYACLFESLESSKLARERVLNIENILFAPKIASSLNARKRMENISPWRSLLQSAGFSALNFSKASEMHAEYLIKSLNSGFSFDKQQGSLLLGWHNKPLLSASAWAC